MRKSGILMHISSLSSPYGIGTMGASAYEFVDFLKNSGQKAWQLLPICPTSYGDSPYQSYSTFAGNPYFIDLDMLAEKGLLKREEYADIDWESEPGLVNYGALYQKRYPVLQKAAERFLAHEDLAYQAFCEENDFWLCDFALFMAIKDAYGGAPWHEWEEGLRNRDEQALVQAKEEHKERIRFWKALQYLFFEQWRELKAYAADNGISIIGDLPIYVSFDSVDVWASPQLFQLDENKMPTEVSGCPPDGFATQGQLWGNPLFDWEYMERDGFAWWIRRIAYLCRVYDILRIDHFRGFDSYYAIPYGASTAALGCWRQGPGMKLFRALEQAVGRQEIIAEDLGYLTESVKQLREQSGFPGMKVMELAFDSRDSSGSEYLPHNFVPNCVAYTGTHDNDTILGWFQEADPEDVIYAREYLDLFPGDDLCFGMMNNLWRSVAELTVVQAQDLLRLGNEARMNRPSTVGNNWRWRALPGAFTPELAAIMKKRMKLFGRF